MGEPRVPLEMKSVRCLTRHLNADLKQAGGGARMAFRREAHAEDRNLTLSWDSWVLKSRDSMRLETVPLGNTRSGQ